MPARLLVGPIPEPADLFGRDGLLSDYKERLGYSNLLLLAPRRFGKSGIMRYFHRQPPDGFTPLWLHLEDVQDGSQFAARLILAVRADGALANKLNKLGAKGTRLLGRLQEIGIDGVFNCKLKPEEAASWPETAAEVIAALEAAEQPILFLWDELPAMLRTVSDREGPEKAREFLAWFRSVRLDASEEVGAHRFIVAGSTDLDYLLDRRLTNPELINDFERVTVGPLDPPADRQLCERLASAAGFTIDDSATEHLLRRIGQAVPYFIQLFFAQARQCRAQIGTTLSVAAIDRVFASRLVNVPCKPYFNQYRRRLKRYSPSIQAAIIEMLATIAVSSAPVGVDVLREIYVDNVASPASKSEFAELLADLECDWYLQRVPDAEAYIFYMSIMRDWWHRWYGSAARRSRSA